MDDTFQEKNSGIPWIGFDLDGTISKFDYQKWQDDKNYIGEPMLRMINLIKHYLSQGIDVKIFTARAENKENIPFIRKWLVAQGLPKLEVTNRKDYAMVRLYDDSAIEVFGNKGMMYTDVFSSIMEPVIGKNRAEILRRMSKMANSSIEGHALAQVLERLFRYTEW